MKFWDNFKHIVSLYFKGLGVFWCKEIIKFVCHGPYERCFLVLVVIVRYFEMIFRIEFMIQFLHSIWIDNIFDDILMYTKVPLGKKIGQLDENMVQTMKNRRSFRRSIFISNVSYKNDRIF